VPDDRTNQLALAYPERTAGKRRRCRRCGQAIIENAGKTGASWSLCGVCVADIEVEARQYETAPPLIRRCMVCRAMLPPRRGVRTCSQACRSLLYRVLRR